MKKEQPLLSLLNSSPGFAPTVRVLGGLALWGSSVCGCLYDPTGSPNLGSTGSSETTTTSGGSDAAGTAEVPTTGASEGEPTAGVECGDGVFGPGEQCDDGNQVDEDACTNACTIARCGDGTRGPGEGCDDGNDEDDDACSNACVLASCGDGELQLGEACDAGGESADCNANCTKAMCGDGITNASAGEGCDDQNDVDEDGCSADCVLSVCGDGQVSPGEDCDDGNIDGADECSEVCREQRVVQIVTGADHACALLSGGVVKCWGRNNSGQLGAGHKEQLGDAPGEMGDALPPVDLGVGRVAMAIDAGEYHTCAVLDGGELKCWGESGFGQLGLGTDQNQGDQPLEMGDDLPVVMLGAGITVKGLSAGGYHTCVRTSDGEVKCWGLNESGQLGIGSIKNIGDDEFETGDKLMATDVSNEMIPKIEMGASHSCAVGLGGSVKCWGFNGAGVLGLGIPGNQGDEPGEMGQNLPKIGLGMLQVVSRLRPGREHTCAVLASGVVKCWGKGVYGTLGTGGVQNIGDDPGEMGDALSPVDLGPGQKVSDVMTGHYTTCALLPGGYLKCWGYNEFGQLGLGNTENQGDEPGEMGDELPVVDLGLPVMELGQGQGSHTACVILSDHSAKCWGRNAYGQLGLGDKDNRGDEPGEMGGNLPRVKLFSSVW